MDISIISAAPSASAQPRSSQGPATATDSFARHLQQAQASAGDDSAGVASPAAETSARTADPVTDTSAAEAQVQHVTVEDNTAPVAADAQPLQALASTTPPPDSSATAAPAQPLDALDEVRRRLALIEQAGQLPGAAAAAGVTAIAPMQAASAAQALGGSPLAATTSSVPAAGRSPGQLPAVAGVSSRQALLQAAAPEAAATDLAVAATTRNPADAGALADASSDLASAPATTSALPDAVPDSTTTASGLSVNRLPPSGMPPSGLPSGIATLTGMAGGAAPSALLAAPLASREWQQDLGQQLIGLHQRGEQQIELHLHPSELGPLSVSLKLGELGAQAQFLSAHPQVRAAVEQAIPQLREALAAQGINLGETSVGAQHQPQGEQQAGGGTGNRQGSEVARVQNDSDAPVAPLAPRTLRGQVDLYA